MQANGETGADRSLITGAERGADGERDALGKVVIDSDAHGARASVPASALMAASPWSWVPGGRSLSRGSTFLAPATVSSHSTWTDRYERSSR